MDKCMDGSLTYLTYVVDALLSFIHSFILSFYFLLEEKEVCNKLS